MDKEEKTDQNCWDNEGFVLKALLHRRVLGGVIIITTYQSNFILWKFDNRLINCFLDLSGEISGECWALARHPASHLLIRLLRNHLSSIYWSDRLLGWWQCLHFRLSYAKLDCRQSRIATFMNLQIFFQTSCLQLQPKLWPNKEK